MSAKVKVNVAKNAEPGVQAAARVAATEVIAALKEITAEAKAAGYDVRVTMKHTPRPAAGWPSGDLADVKSWRP